MGWWQTIITALASILGGAFTFFGVYITLKYQSKKDRYDRRPNLMVTDYKPMSGYDKESTSDLGIFFTLSEQEKLSQNVLEDKKNWICVEYTFKNVGKSGLVDICVATLLHGNSHIKVIEGDARFVSDYGGQKLACLCRKCLKPQETFRLKICYFHDVIDPQVKGAASISLWLTDSDRKTSWRQLLFAPDNVLTDSVCLSYKRLFKEISPSNPKRAWRNWRKEYREAYKKLYK